MVHRFVIIRAVVARADLVAALGLLALAPHTRDIFSVVDENVVVGAFKGVAVDLRRG